MSSALYILPFVIALASVGLLFLDPKNTNMLVGAIAIFLASLGMAYSSVTLLDDATASKERRLQKVAYLEDWKERQIARLHGILAQFRPQTDETAFKMNHFASLGWNIKNEAFIRSLTADQARERLIEELPKKHFISKPVIIKNLPEDLDRLIVAQALEELGFLVDLPEMDKKEDDEAKGNKDPDKETSEEGNSKEGAEKDKEKDKKAGDAEKKEASAKKKGKKKEEKPEIKRINVMYYGPHVKTHEIKLIALTMMRAGINLKLIRLSKQSSGAAARSVIFDWSKTYTSRPNLSPLDIYKKKSFRRS